MLKATKFVYTVSIHIIGMNKTARLFNNGGSQAVRLPAEFRFDGDEVFVRRDVRTGDVILSKKSGWSTWAEYFEQRGAKSFEIPEEFLFERPLNAPLST